MSERKRYFVGITGASGHAYTRALIQSLVRAGCDVDISATGAAAEPESGSA